MACVLILVGLCAASISHVIDAHVDLDSDGQLRGAPRKLWKQASDLEHVWGTCERWDSRVSGCTFKSNKCGDRLSDGPDGADLVITLANLTASTPSQAVHLQWWAPRASESAWNPTESSDGCAVYWRMRYAYPKFTDDDYNGGNVRVNEMGEATIRVKAPATYFVSRWISVPHIHLRLCSNESFGHFNQDAIVFHDGVQMAAGDRGAQMRIKSVVNLTWAADTGNIQNIKDQYIAGILVLKDKRPDAGHHADGNGERQQTTTTPMIMDPSTTSIAPTVTQSSPNNTKIQIIEDAKDDMNLDALEFSPVYQCFEQGEFFDHYTGDCASECSDSQGIANGQCVRQAVQPEASIIDGVWEMRADCNDECWRTWKNVTMHYTRLAMADLLDIPFQEVDKVSFSFEQLVSGRRLATGRRASLQLQVQTKRLDKSEAKTLMSLFLSSPAVASEIFNFPVGEVTMTSISTDGTWQDTSKGTTVVTDYLDNDNDPYQSAYSDNQPEIKRGGNLQSIGGIPVAGVPMEVILAVAVCVVVFIGGFFFYLWWRRKKAASAHAEMTANGTIIGSIAGGSAGKTVDDDYPTKPTQANPNATNLEAKAQDPW